MLTYQYHCTENGETLEVRHGMKERLATWGEVCARLERETGKTPAETPVERVITGGILGTVNGGTPKADPLPSLPMAGCCGKPASCRHHG